MKKLTPIRNLDRLDHDERAQLWTALENGLSYSRAVRRLGAEHFIQIKRHKLYTWWHRERVRRDLNAHLPADHQLDTAKFLDLLNSQSLPWPDLIHSQIHKAAFLLTCRDENTPARLLTLQRLANNGFNQELAREKLTLEKRKHSLREKELTWKMELTTESETKSQIAHHKSKIESDDLGPYAATLEEVEARTRKKFNITDEQIAPPR